MFVEAVGQLLCRSGACEVKNAEGSMWSPLVTEQNCHRVKTGWDEQTCSKTFFQESVWQKKVCYPSITPNSSLQESLRDVMDIKRRLLEQLQGSSPEQRPGYSKGNQFTRKLGLPVGLTCSCITWLCNFCSSIHKFSQSAG